jgi:hypothetical protein
VNELYVFPERTDTAEVVVENMTDTLGFSSISKAAGNSFFTAFLVFVPIDVRSW